MQRPSSQPRRRKAKGASSPSSLQQGLMQSNYGNSNNNELRPLSPSWQPPSSRGGGGERFPSSTPIPPHTPVPLSSPMPSNQGMRYVDIRVAIPDDGNGGPYHPTSHHHHDNFMGYIQTPPHQQPYYQPYQHGNNNSMNMMMMSPSPLTVSSSSLSHIHERGAMTPSPTSGVMKGGGGGGGMRRGATAFVPIHHHQQQQHHQRHQNHHLYHQEIGSSSSNSSTPARGSSPYDFGKHHTSSSSSPSPSLMSYDTLETASMTLDSSYTSSSMSLSSTPTSGSKTNTTWSSSSSRLRSPLPPGLASLVPPLYRPSPTSMLDNNGNSNNNSMRSSRSRLESPRPNTPSSTSMSRPNTPTSATTTTTSLSSSFPPRPKTPTTRPKTPTIVTTPSSLQLALIAESSGDAGSTTPKSNNNAVASSGAGGGGRIKSPSTSSASLQSPVTPFPKNNLAAEGVSDDLVRKTRLKTEMCMHYEQGHPCPFGSQCTYAHGVEELQMTKLLDLHKAGLVDVETHRTRPCFSWVATGCCPFGKRCTGIHDPRVAGTSSSWLTHTETQGNTIATDINVESMHQKLHHHIQHGTPFGEQFSLLSDSWSDLYKKICNMDSVWIDTSSISRQRHRGGGEAISPIIKLQIALVLRGDPDWLYKYRPQHMIYEELCMVLQKRAFRLTKSSKQSDVVDSAVEIALKAYNPRLQNHVMVHEIAFGPDQDSSVRGVALWFNVDEIQVVECTSAQAKRFRWKRGLKKEPNDQGKNKSNAKSSTFDHIDNFLMVRPHDEDAFNLATDIIKHRLAFLTKERMSNMKERFEALNALEVEKKVLQERFENIRRHWKSWAWPVNSGREIVDKRTCVPSIDGRYEPPKCSSYMLSNRVVDKYQKEDENDPKNVVGEAVHPIWSSFARSCETMGFGGEHNIMQGGNSELASTGRRLSIFEDLASGRPLSDDRTLPHIKNGYRNHGANRRQSKEIFPSPNRQQERCWKALLLKSESIHGASEWDLVREHFENSRSKKVLSIIQQK